MSVYMFYLCLFRVPGGLQKTPKERMEEFVDVMASILDAEKYAYRVACNR